MLPNKRQKAVGDNVDVEVEVKVEVEVEDKVDAETWWQKQADERYGKQMHEYNAEVLKRHVVHVPLRPEGLLKYADNVLASLMNHENKMACLGYSDTHVVDGTVWVETSGDFAKLTAVPLPWHARTGKELENELEGALATGLRHFTKFELRDFGMGDGFPFHRVYVKVNTTSGAVKYLIPERKKVYNSYFSFVNNTMYKVSHHATLPQVVLQTLLEMYDKISERARPQFHMPVSVPSWADKKYIHPVHVLTAIVNHERAVPSDLDFIWEFFEMFWLNACPGMPTQTTRDRDKLCDRILARYNELEVAVDGRSLGE